MGYIRDQFRFHPLALHFLRHRIAEAFLDPVDLWFKGFKHAQIFLYGHIQITLSYLIGSL